MTLSPSSSSPGSSSPSSPAPTTDPTSDPATPQAVPTPDSSGAAGSATPPASGTLSASACTCGAKAMPALDDAFRVPATKVDGCASQVWLLPRIDGQGRGARFDFQGDSDAMIVRGLIAILHALYGGLQVGEVLAVDAPAELRRLGLDEHLSSQRSNGLRAMVARIRKHATDAAA